MPYGLDGGYHNIGGFLDGGGSANTFAFLASASAGAPLGVHNVTTSGIDTTGASLLVVVMSAYNETPVVTDSKSNTWTDLTVYSATDRVLLSYCIGGTVGTGHTFTVTTTAGYPSICAASYTSTGGTPAFDKENGSGSAAVSTIQPGSVTPLNSNSLIVTGLAADQTTETVDGGFTERESVANVAAEHIQSAFADLIQTTASAVNPTWDTGVSGNMAANIAVFYLA